MPGSYASSENPQVEGAEAKIKEMSNWICSWRKSLVKQWFLYRKRKKTLKNDGFLKSDGIYILRFFFCLLIINVLTIGTIKIYTTKHTMHVIICVHLKYFILYKWISRM